LVTVVTIGDEKLKSRAVHNTHSYDRLPVKVDIGREVGLEYAIMSPEIALEVVSTPEKIMRHSVVMVICFDKYWLPT
jgi:hypothetical protein